MEQEKGLKRKKNLHLSVHRTHDKGGKFLWFCHQGHDKQVHSAQDAQYHLLLPLQPTILLNNLVPSKCMHANIPFFSMLETFFFFLFF